MSDFISTILDQTTPNPRPGAVLRGAHAETWVTTEFALSMFHAERDTALQAYRHFIDSDLNQPSPSPLQHRNPDDPRILGSDTFVARLLGTAWRPRSHKTLDELIAEACQKFATTRQALISSSRNRQLTQARAWIAHQALTLRIASLSQAARRTVPGRVLGCFSTIAKIFSPSLFVWCRRLFKPYTN